MITSPGQKGSGFTPLSTLMPGSVPSGLDDLDQWRAVLGLLPDGLVEQDHAGDVRHALGAEQELAVVAAIVFGALDPDHVETLLDGARGFVRGEHALAGRHQGVGNSVELSEIHVSLPFSKRTGLLVYFTAFPIWHGSHFT